MVKKDKIIFLKTKAVYRVFEINIPTRQKIIFIQFKAELEKKFDMYYSLHSFSNRCLHLRNNGKNLHIRVLIDKKFVDEFKNFVQDFWAERKIVVEVESE